jgi:hypothetical protein
MAKRTVMRSSKGKKLYAVRDKKGQFKDIQQYSRAHAQDIKRGSKAEKKTARKATKKRAAKKTAKKRPAKRTSRKTATKRTARKVMSGARRRSAASSARSSVQ